jgi:hypothetical protein
MEDPNAAARRLLVGVTAATLLSVCVLLWILPGVSRSGSAVMWRGACGRVGIVTAALWFALPARGRPAAWANLNPRSVAAVVIAALAIRFPLRLLLPLGGILMIVGVLLRPRPRARPPRPGEIEQR